MCGCDAADLAVAWREKERRASRAYRCYECGGQIDKGEKYTALCFLAAGEGWSTIHVHTLCWKATTHLQSDCDCTMWGELFNLLDYEDRWQEAFAEQPDTLGHIAGLVFARDERRYDAPLYQEMLRRRREKQAAVA